MKSAVTISLVPQAKGGPFVFWEDLAGACQEAAALGFDAVEIFPPSAGAIKHEHLQELLEQYHLRIAAVGTGAGWLMHRWSLTHSDASVRKQANAFIKEVIDLAAGFEAPAIIGSMQGRWENQVSQEQGLEWLAQSLQELGSHAAQRGQILLYEPLNRYETNLINRLDQAVHLIRSSRIQHVKILADLFHLNIEEKSVAEAIRNASGYIGHVHFADSNRQAVGFGHTNMKPIISALRDNRFEGYLSAEVFPLPDSKAAARQTMKSFRDILN
jgi:sugar phosphate isomerase/epimerase